jgi:hypothetical protein
MAIAPITPARRNHRRRQAETVTMPHKATPTSAAPNTSPGRSSRKPSPTERCFPVISNAIATRSMIASVPAMVVRSVRARFLTVVDIRRAASLVHSVDDFDAEDAERCSFNHSDISPSLKSTICERAAADCRTRRRLPSRSFDLVCIESCVCRTSSAPAGGPWGRRPVRTGEC